MRVIAGKLKGHQLVSFSADHVRPTTDRVKQSIFNKVAAHVDGGRVLDLYSGTGSLAIEAHSQGALAVTAVESHPKSVQIIKENLKKLKIEKEIQVISIDVFKSLSRFSGEAFDLVLVDPPFTRKLAHETLLAIMSSKVLKPGSVVVVEASSHETVEDSYPPLQLIDRRDYGDKKISFFACP